MKMRMRIGGLLALLLSISAAMANAPRPDASAHGVDAQLKRALESVREGPLDAALGEVDKLIARYPNFRLAHLVRGDLLLARAQPLAGFGNTGHAARDAFMQQLEAWRKDWESLDTERYLGHYAKGFRSGAMDLAAWRAHKRKVGTGKTSIKVSLDNLGVFRSPGRQDLVEVSFDQDYRSNNLSQRTRKRQYWLREGGRWMIAYEAPLRGAAKVALPESFPNKR